MTVVQLVRVDPARNMCRFYRLDVQPDLFGGVTLIREWGRVGRAAQVRSAHFADHADAVAALGHRQRASSGAAIQGTQSTGKMLRYSDLLLASGYMERVSFPM